MAGPQIVHLVVAEVVEVVGGGGALGPDGREDLVGGGDTGVGRDLAVDVFLAVRIPAVGGAAADLAEIGAVHELQRRDIEHHVALRRGTVDGRGGQQIGGRAKIARVGHHREFVAGELRLERGEVVVSIAVREAKGMAEFMSDGKEGVGSKILWLNVAI